MATLTLFVIRQECNSSRHHGQQHDPVLHSCDWRWQQTGSCTNMSAGLPCYCSRSSVGCAYSSVYPWPLCVCDLIRYIGSKISLISNSNIRYEAVALRCDARGDHTFKMSGHPVHHQHAGVHHCPTVTCQVEVSVNCESSWQGNASASWLMLQW